MAIRICADSRMIDLFANPINVSRRNSGIYFEVMVFLITSNSLGCNPKIKLSRSF